MAPAEPEAVPEKKLADPYVRMGYMPKDGPTPSFPRGLLGAFIGCLVGSLIWYAIFYFGEIDFGWLALIPAVMSGMLGRKMAREDNHYIGVVAAVFTVLAIFGTRYAVVSHGYPGKHGADTMAEFQLPTYDEHMAEAKEAVAAQTDDEIRNFLQNQNRRVFQKFAKKGEPYKPVGIGNDRVKLFKEFELKEFQEFANGKPSREEYEKTVQSAKSAGTWTARIVTALTVIISTGIFGIFSLLFAISVAYRTGSG